jgi:hypothetical protein
MRPVQSMPHLTRPQNVEKPRPRLPLTLSQQAHAATFAHAAAGEQQT